MGVIAENPFAFNGDRSKFDLSRIFLRKLYTFPLNIPTTGNWMISRYSIPAAPTNGVDVVNYNYKPIAINIASEIAGIQVAEVTMYQPGSDSGTWQVQAVIYNSGSQTTGKANISFYVWYMRKDIIRVVS